MDVTLVGSRRVPVLDAAFVVGLVAVVEPALTPNLKLDLEPAFTPVFTCEFGSAEARGGAVLAVGADVRADVAPVALIRAADFSGDANFPAGRLDLLRFAWLRA